MQTRRLTRTLRRAHPPRTGGQAARDDGRQQLRGDADGDGQREQQGVEDRLVQHDVDDEDRRGQRRRRRTRAAARSGAARAGTRCRAGGCPGPAAILPNSVRGPVATTTPRPDPGVHDGAHQRAAGELGQRRARGRPRAVLFSTGIDSPVSTDSSQLEPDGVEQADVGRHDVAEPQLDHVAGHERGDVDRLGPPAADRRSSGAGSGRAAPRPPSRRGTR